MVQLRIKTNKYYMMLTQLVCMYLTEPRTGFGTRLIFKRSKAGLNSEFSFS